MISKPGVQLDRFQGLKGCTFTFGGINNIIDSTNLDIESGKVADAINVNFDNTNSINLRLGYLRVATGSYHSGWNNDSKTLAYFVSGGYIYEFDGVNAPLPIISVTAGHKMEFVQVNNAIVYSNGIDFGIFGDDYLQTRTYSPEFKAATKGGRCLEFYNGRLYFARNNVLHCSDTFDVEHVDVRFNHVATFQHKITMCKRVEDGLWIGTEGYVYFLKGDDIREGGFEQIIAAKAGVVYGTACKTNAEYIPEAQNTNNLVIFLTSQGIASGGNGGKYINHSFNEVSFDVGTTGTATLRNENGSTYYIVSFNIDSEYEYFPYSYNIELDVNTL